VQNTQTSGLRAVAPQSPPAAPDGAAQLAPSDADTSVMTFRHSVASLFWLCSISCAAGLACHPAQPMTPREGTIDFVVHQKQLAPTGAAAAGRFDVRGLDNDERASVGIGRGAGRTLHVRLPAGTYTVSWKPVVTPNGAGTAPVKLSDADPAWPQVVVVAPNRATIVDVVLGSKGDLGERALELASAGSRAALGSD
jgi:hypothetical protein